MATPFKNPRDDILHFRREVPEKLRAAFDGKQIVKVSLRTRDPIEAKAHFARENAKFEKQLADARRRIAEGILVSTPGPWSDDGVRVRRLEVPCQIPSD